MSRTLLAIGAIQVARYPTAPVKAHPALKAINNLLKSLLLLIASLYSVIKGTSALALQYPEIYKDAEISAATLTDANNSGAALRKTSARVLTSDKSTCTRDQMSRMKVQICAW